MATMEIETGMSDLNDLNNNEIQLFDDETNKNKKCNAGIILDITFLNQQKYAGGKSKEDAIQIEENEYAYDMKSNPQSPGKSGPVASRQPFQEESYSALKVTSPDKLTQKFLANEKQKQCQQMQQLCFKQDDDNDDEFNVIKTPNRKSDQSLKGKINNQQKTLQQITKKEQINVTKLNQLRIAKLKMLIGQRTNEDGTQNFILTLPLIIKKKQQKTRVQIDLSDQRLTDVTVPPATKLIQKRRPIGILLELPLQKTIKKNKQDVIEQTQQKIELVMCAKTTNQPILQILVRLITSNLEELKRIKQLSRPEKAAMRVKEMGRWQSLLQNQNQTEVQIQICNDDAMQWQCDKGLTMEERISFLHCQVPPVRVCKGLQGGVPQRKMTYLDMIYANQVSQSRPEEIDQLRKYVDDQLLVKEIAKRKSKRKTSERKVEEVMILSDSVLCNFYLEMRNDINMTKRFFDEERISVQQIVNEFSNLYTMKFLKSNR